LNEVTSELINKVKNLIHSARKTAYQNINTLQIITNLEIGRLIVEHEQRGSIRADYGSRLINTLSRGLTTEFGRGFSTTNLKLMRKFYLMRKEIFGTSQTSVSIEKSQTVSDISQQSIGSDQMDYSLPFNLSWSHYVFLMSIEDDNERHFYQIEALNNSWSLRELKRQFGSSLYERLALSRDIKSIKEMFQKGHIVDRPEDLLKEPYVLEFLGLKEERTYSESDLESAIIDKLEHFLLELGKGFLFEARQKRFTFDSDHFYVDLVFYNRILRCYVLIDLKIDKLTHQDLGQMQMYVNYFDRYVKMEDEKPTIGVILCKTKSDALVRLTLPPDTKVYPRKYQLFIPSKELLKRKILEWAEEKVVEDQDN
jgi:predicted nuclease of restriction endonuclease-like (RecB) superfamily